MSLSQSDICLSLQRALLDKITNNLRSVSFEVSENTIILNFYYGSEITDIEKELAEDAAAEVISDFLERNKIKCNLYKYKDQDKLKPHGNVVFSRYE